MITQNFDVRHLLIVGISLVVLTGCASPTVINPTVINPTVINTYPRSVILTGAHSNNVVEAQNLAESECQKHGRHAIHRPDSQRDGVATYECLD